VASYATLFFAAGCTQSRGEKRGDAGPGAVASSVPSASANPASGSFADAAGNTDVGAGPAVSATSARSAASAAETPFPRHAARTTLKFDKPVDLGPAGAVVATPSGAIFRTRGDELVGFTVAGSPAAPKRIGTAEKGPLPSNEALTSRAPSPAFTSGSFAYWVSHGRLVRRAWSAAANAPSTLEVLATDALDGARVAAASLVAEGSAKRRDVAIYIARAENEKAERTARIWTEGAGHSLLSSEGSGASSVALAMSGQAGVAVMLDARAAMSPVHARTIDVGDTGHARLGTDVVVFIGPSPEAHHEVVAAPGSDGPVAFIPFPTDTSSFGLASIEIGSEPHLDAKVQWRMYPSGIDPAPVAAAAICGRTWVAYARPLAAPPSTEQVIALAPTEKGVFGPELTAARGFDLTSVSLAPRDDGGAWIVWVGNGRSFLGAVRCG
jgi:hypothetical protein